MSLLDLIREDESLEFISLKEAINLLARKTNSNIFGVATYLLNKKVHILLNSHARQNNKIEATSISVNQKDWHGENDCYFWLNYITGNEKHKHSFGIEDSSEYNAGCQESFWRRETFLNLECIKSLNLFSTKEWNELFKKQQYIWDAQYINILKNDVPDLQGIDPGTYVNESIYFEAEPPYQEIKKFPLYFKYNTFTPQEVACLISNYHPSQVGNDWNNITWLNDNPEFYEALDFAFSAVRGDLFREIDENDYVISSDELKKLLNSKDIFIDGFNNQECTSQSNENLAENTNLKNTIADLELNVAIEQATVNKLNKEIEKLKIELLEKEQKIKELESLHQKNESDLINLIFDESATERYAPDLVLSIKLWEHTYITNPKNDSHSNKADTWLGKNTKYDIAKKQGSASKIREITTPFVNWGNLRDKNYQK